VAQDGDLKIETTDAHERVKNFLDPDEMKTLLDTARRRFHGARDHLLLLMMYHHGLRVTEAIDMRLDQLSLQRARLWVRRVKGSLSVEHPIAGDALRALRRYLALRDSHLPWLFIFERKGQLTRQAVNFIVGETGRAAGLGRVHPHMLRHSCGFHLANTGVDLRTAQDYLGHRDPKHTVRYTRVAGRRFEGLW